MTELKDDAAVPVKYGSFNSRMLANTLDISVLFFFALPAIDYLMAQFFPSVDNSSLLSILNTSSAQEDAPNMLSALWQMTKDQHLIERIIVENLLQGICVAFYVLPFWMYYSATPGKMLLRLKIVDAKTHAPMTDKQSVLRVFGYLVSLLPLWLGFIWILFDKQHRGFHDMIAGTVVIVRPKKKVVSG